ncbi:helix-turn-helix transcriptional regulator [Belliella buryatensis]|uniref:helix-turn-helix transcriptional regulator n=1 Tax=Belliella buryatensis TaxID=1500549 RepID=UPI001482EBA3|nr:LuxR C-terminal-related transcriptional regulator [Belliella buryatensis]
MESKDKELTAQAAQVIQMQQQLEVAKEKVANILYEGSTEQNKVDRIDAVLNKSSLSEVKNSFDLRLTSNNEVFFKTLLKNYPELTPSELKLCAYLRLNLPTKDLAEILNRSVGTIESSRTNIRKKLNLQPQENLVTHLLSLASQE